MTKSIYLIDYTGPDVEAYINYRDAFKAFEVVQILPVSARRVDNKSGMSHCDYLLVYKEEG